MKKLILPLSLLLCAGSAAYGLNADHSKITDIVADYVEYNNSTGVAKYVGHVSAAQGSTRFQADKVALYRNKKNEIEKIEMIGEPAHFLTQPDNITGSFEAKAKAITIYPMSGKVFMVDNGVAKFAGNTFRGSHLSYDINKQVLISEPTNDSQTSIALSAPAKKTSTTEEKKTI